MHGDGSEAAAGSSDPIEQPAYAHLMRRVDLFAGLDRITLAKLAAHLQPLSYSSRAVIFEQGDVGDAFYLVASGSVGVYVTDKTGAAETRTRLLQPGEPFGEMALLTNTPRTATIKAETDCEVLRLERNAFLQLVREHPSVALAIAATLSRRLAGMLAQGSRAEAATTVADVAPTPAREVPAAASAPTPSWRPGRTGIAFAAALVIFALGWVLPPPSGLSPAGWYALIALLAALPALVLDALVEGVLAFLLAAAWVLADVASPADALAGFATTSWVLVVAVLIIGAAITATGLLYRLALGTITHIRGGFAGEVTAISLAGLLLGPAVPNPTSRVIIMAPMLKELVEALGYRPQSRASAGLSMAVLIGFGQMAAAFLTSSTTAVLIAALVPPHAGKEINWVSWAFYGAPINLILFCGLVGSILWLYRPAAGHRPMSSDRVRSLALQRALLGPMSRDEKIALGVGISLLIGFSTQPLHGINPAWVAVLATAVLSAMRVVTVDTLRAVNWNFALLFGILISLATVFGHTGLDRWMADQVAATMGDLLSSRLAFVLALTVFCFAISFVVRCQAAAPLVTIALAPVASAAGIHPIVVGLIALIACNGFFLPYQSTIYLALYAGTGGQLFSHAQALPAAMAYAVWTIIAVALSVPVWHWMGLL